jgi:ribose-phosphate pyrophosphokinase
MIYLNDTPVPTTVFPDNTSQVWKLPPLESYVTVKWRYSNEGEFMQLAQLKDLLDHLNVKAQLDILYLPYARQDKGVSNTSTFALRTFARHLNMLDFDWITILDPHSDVATDLIKNCSARYPHDRVKQVFGECGSTVVCYPDEGAFTRYAARYNLVSIRGEKFRDPSTGLIKTYELHGDCEGDSVLIVDDICDGGATFRLLAQMLLKDGAAEVNLFVTHGIFSKGVRHLFDAGINRIFTNTEEVTRRSFQ